MPPRPCSSSCQQRPPQFSVCLQIHGLTRHSGSWPLRVYFIVSLNSRCSRHDLKAQWPKNKYHLPKIHLFQISTAAIFQVISRTPPQSRQAGFTVSGSQAAFHGCSSPLQPSGDTFATTPFSTAPGRMHGHFALTPSPSGQPSSQLLNPTPTPGSLLTCLSPAQGPTTLSCVNQTSKSPCTV